MARRYGTPIITLAVKNTDQINALIEGFETGKAFWKRIWKHKIWTTRANHSINVLFGHKFFHWCNLNNDRVWISTAPGVPSIMDWNGWTKLMGEVHYAKGNKRVLTIKVVRVIL